MLPQHGLHTPHDGRCGIVQQQDIQL
jgi:hypothetical protein